MILNVYCYYNKLLQAFGNFQLDDHNADQVCAGLSRDLRARFLEGKAENLKYIELYCLGTFDDETGAFVNDKKLILDLGSVIAGFEAQRAAKQEEISKEA